MSEKRRLPAPATQVDEYLWAIVMELRAINGALASLTPPQPSPNEGGSGEETEVVELREPAPAVTKRQRKSAKE